MGQRYTIKPMSSLQEKLTEIKVLISAAESETASLLSGKKASAPRIRVALQKVKGLCHTLRSDVMAHTKALPVKNRAKKETEEMPPPLVLERQDAVCLKDADLVNLDEDAPVKKTRAKKAIKKKIIK